MLLKCIQKYYPGVEELNLLHKIVPYNSVGSLVKKVGKDLADTDFYERFDNLIAEYVLPLVPSDLLVQRFGNIRINVPNQDGSGTVIPFHQGQWVGNGLGLRTIWLPFTECFESNSLQIIEQYESRLLTKQCLKYNYKRKEK